MMKGLIRHIPNFLTCMSLLCGFYAVILSFSGNYFGAMLAIFAAAIFDFSDGLAARLLRAYSDMGKELDSLADVISFGVAPGMMLFSYFDCLLHSLSWNDSFFCKLFLLASFAIPVFSALRLAKFNIDVRQKTSFIGLPVPAHAMFWSSLITVLMSDGAMFNGFFPQLAMLLASVSSEIILVSLSITVVITSLLLVTEMPMFSLKVNSLSWKINRLPFLLIASSVVFVVLFGVVGITLTILFYIVLSLIAGIHSCFGKQDTNLRQG